MNLGKEPLAEPRGRGAHECKTEITSEREKSKVLATALFDKGAGPLIKEKF